MKIAIIACIFLYFCACNAQTKLPEDAEKAIIDLFEAVNDSTPGYVVGVIKDSEFLIKKGYGSANLEHRIPITPTSTFNVASLSKQFTAACIALLILDEKLTLEDKVRDLLPNFPPYTPDIKVKHLIYMTSGLPEYYAQPRKNNTDWSSLNFFNVDTAIAASLSSGELMYPPGTQWSYSNINYMLLTKIVAQLSGMSFSEFTRTRIFEPLEMTATRVNDDIFEVIFKRVTGYNVRNQENTGWLIEGGYLQGSKKGYLQINRHSPHYGGSGIYTSLVDLKKWDDNFYSHHLGGQEFYNLMHHRMKFEHEKTNDAFGLVFGDFNGHEMVWYESGDWGFSSFMMRFPKYRLTVVCLSNLGTGNARKKAMQVLDVLIAHRIVNFN